MTVKSATLQKAGLIGVSIAALSIIYIFNQPEQNTSSAPSPVQVVTGGSTSSTRGTVDPLLPVLASSSADVSSLNLTGDPEQTRLLLSRQPRDQVWATSAESAIQKAFAQSGAQERINVDCRTTGCEIKGELAGLTTANLQGALDRIAGAELNSRITKSGMLPDKSPVYTVVSQEPLKVAFSRLVSRSSAN